MINEYGNQIMIVTEQKEKISFMRSAALPDVELLMARDSLTHWRFYHERHAVCSCDKVAAEIRYRGKLHAVADGNSLLFEPGETHSTYNVTTPQSFQVLYFTPESVKRFSEEMDIPGDPHFKDTRVNCEQLFSASKRLQTSMIDDAPAIEQETCQAQYLGLLLSNHSERHAVSPPDIRKYPLVRARDFIQDNFARSISLDELTAITGLSRYYLLKAFANQYGLPPHRYQTHVRIERSLFLLRQGMTLSHVACATGFTDQSHFFRHFKRVMGVTPGIYQGKKTG